jgi:hypothetical protein
MELEFYHLFMKSFHHSSLCVLVQVGLVICEVIISTLKCDSASNVCKEALYDPSQATHLILKFITSCVPGGRDECCGSCQAVKKHENVNYVNAAIPVAFSALGMIGSSHLTRITNNKIYTPQQVSKQSQLVCAAFMAWYLWLSPVFGLLKRLLFFRNNHDHEPQEMAQQTCSPPSLTTLFRSQGTTANVCKRMKPASTVFCPSRRVINTVTFLSVLCRVCAGASSHYTQTQPHSSVQQQMTAYTFMMIMIIIFVSIQDESYATM